MTSRRTITLVAGREISDRLRNKGFLLGTGVTLLLLLAFIVVPTLVADDDRPAFDLGVVGELDPLLVEAITVAGEAQGVDVTLATVDDRAAATTAVEEGTLDGVLVDPDHLLVAGDVNERLRGVVDQARQQSAVLGGLAEAGVDPAQAAALLAGRPSVTIVTPEGTEEERESTEGLAFFMTVLLFIVLQINGSTLLTGTIEEKSSRVVEVLLGSVRPWQLLTGKLGGMMVLAIGQLALFIGVALASILAVDAFEIPPSTTGAIAVGTLMFVLGFAFYTALYAVAGSMASSLEDAQTAAAPLGFLTVGAYTGTLLGVVPNPETVLAEVLTYLPPTAPFAVPARVAVGAIGPVEVVLAAAVTAAGAIVTIRIAGRLYSAALLAGGRLSWRQIWRAEAV